MASTSTQTLSTNGSSSTGWKYDVFISFRGEDTRNSFADHLRTALIRKGFNVFDDEEKMEIGKPISQELINAIEASRTSIIVLSRNYASSSWCLDELVKIVQCGNDRGQTIIPVYYDVSSSDVKEEIFEKHFNTHEEIFGEDTEKVQSWRSAMREVTNLHGWELGQRRESKFIEDIVEDISNKLHPSGSSSSFMNLKALLMGVKSCLEKLRMQGETNLPRLQSQRPIRSFSTALFFFLVS